MGASDKPDLKRIIDRGLLPENLPSVVTSKGLWPHFDVETPSYLITSNRVGRTSPFNASKRGFQRRLFGLPHPAFLYDQALFLTKHWDAIAQLFDTSPGSLSRPSFPIVGPRSTRITSHSALPRARLEAFSRFKYCLVTDVSRCFPSVYTHSLPWAIHGKEASKADTKVNSAGIFGNRLDFAIRQGQDRQTMGIPVGPDTSRVASEIILSAVDREFLVRSGSKRVTYRRHVDDYWIGGHTIEECERHLQLLREALREYELDINELKTRIVNTSVVFGESWAFEIADELRGAFPFFGTPRGDQIATLGKIIDRARSTNDDGVIRHAIRKLDEQHAWDRHWDVLEHFLAQCAVQFHHSFDYVARVVAWRLRRQKSIDNVLWSEVTRTVAGRAASLGRDSEALWSLWLMKELSIKVNKALSSAIIKNNGPIVSALLAHIYAHNLTTDKLIVAQMWDRVEGNHFFGSFWPLTLELATLALSKPAALNDGGGDDVMRKLHQNNASLIDWGAAPAVFDKPEKQGAWFADVEPEEAIEDYTSDYDDDDDDSDDDEDSDDDDADTNQMQQVDLEDPKDAF